MNEQNIKLSVIAYYLSKFDLEAVHTLGFNNRTDALNNISNKVGNGNNYLKLRRDEFDVLTNSHRRGYANRVPTRGVLEMHNLLKQISFKDFTQIVLQFISSIEPITTTRVHNDIIELTPSFSEAEIEAIINSKDSTSKVVLRQSAQKARVYNLVIIDNLKKLYSYRCQICGYSADEYGVHICEAHHILPFFEYENNDSDNIIIVCPNHHRVIHKVNPIFDKDEKAFIFANQLKLHLMLNLHL